jgi:T5orf172 domain-containing protein
MRSAQPTSAAFGWAYVLTNSAFEEDVYKIGVTTLHPTERARQLSAASGVPTPFAVAYKRHVRHPFVVEAALHREFDAFRTNDSREFFRVPLHQIITALETYEETGVLTPYPFASLFATFDQDGPDELTADERDQCRALEDRLQ